MSKVKIDISVSLDGYVAGPDPSLDDPLGKGGEQLHEWVVGLAAWRKPHGLEGGETNQDSEVVEELTAGLGATAMGRRMFSGGSGPWEEDPNANGWWGAEPPFRHPVFVLTHHPRERLEMKGGTTFEFVTDGVEAALERARVAADGKDVNVSGGADAVQQCLNARLVDEMQLHVVPVALGSGRRLLDGLDPAIRFEIDRVIDLPSVTHLRYRVS